ncbi:MAG TPA: hypothetical protein V6C65_32010, partial [Allocoleopsis sp.]
LSEFEQATPLQTLFSGRPIQLTGATNDSVSRRLGYFFSLDTQLRQALDQAFTTGILQRLTIEIVSQDELYQAQAQAQNIFHSDTRQGIVRLAESYVIGAYDNPCAIFLAGIENEFSEIILRARYYAAYRTTLQPSVFQESSTFAMSSLVSLLLQGEQFNSAEEVRVFLQDLLTLAQQSYGNRNDLPRSSSEQESAFIATWLNQRLDRLLPVFPDGIVQFVIDTSAGRGNVIRPIVVSPSN